MNIELIRAGCTTQGEGGEYKICVSFTDSMFDSGISQIKTKVFEGRRPRLSSRVNSTGRCGLQGFNRDKKDVKKGGVDGVGEEV